MSNEIPEDPYRIIARERSHDEAKESVATNRMLVQSLILINGGAASLARLRKLEEIVDVSAFQESNALIKAWAARPYKEPFDRGQS